MHRSMEKRWTLTWPVVLAMPVLLVSYGWFMNHRPALHVQAEWTLTDALIQNSDLLLSGIFLVAAVLPFWLIYDRRKAGARDLVPVALMAALCVVGRAAFALIPLPNFKPVTAIVIVTALAFGPEAGYLTGALAGFLSNFLFGQDPWTPWQMFSWGMMGLLAGILYRIGVLGSVGTEGADREGKRKKPVRLCVFGFLCGFLYGWIMDLYYIVGWVDPINWKTVAAAYASSFVFDLSHGICTALVLWFAAEPWVRKLLRVKHKFGLMQEESCSMPPCQGDSRTRQQ